jgi:hypothetical protein
MAAARIRDDDIEAPPTRPGLNAYTGLIVISLIATIMGLVFVFLDYNSYREDPPATKALQAPAAPAAQPAAAPVQQPPAAAPKQKTAPSE